MSDGIPGGEVFAFALADFRGQIVRPTSWVEDRKMEEMVDRVIVSDPDIMNGTPCFRGTRVPFKNLIDYLEGGHPLGEFLRQFPTVTRDMAVQALEEAKESLLAKIA